MIQEARYKEPVRIKYYGLIPMTKMAYLITTAIAGLFFFMVVAAALALGQIPETRLPWDARINDLWPRVWNLWTLGFFLFLEALDITLTLRKYAQKEAEQRANLPEEQSARPFMPR